MLRKWKLIRKTEKQKKNVSRKQKTTEQQHNNNYCQHQPCMLAINATVLYCICTVEQ